MEFSVAAHDGFSVEFAHVVPGGEFVDVRAQVLRADLVEDSAVPTLEQGPKALYAIRIDFSAHVLTTTLFLHPLMARKRPVAIASSVYTLADRSA